MVRAASPVDELRLASQGDEPSMVALYRGLSAESRRMRFSTTVSDRVLVQAAALGDRFDAVLAFSEGRLIGEARIDTSTGSDHELAITVADGWQGHGVGHVLLDGLREHANDRGIVVLRAFVRNDNVPMLTLLRRVGGVIVMISGADVVLEIASDAQMPGWPSGTTTTKVLVEAGGLAERAITTSLRAAGFDVRQCAGPASGRREPCPLLVGGRCRLADEADAIVCLLNDDDESRAVVSSHALQRPGSLAAGFALTRR
jgi:GNAT superfamily N-acetyltransferase